jgi:hypothetical protein
MCSCTIDFGRSLRPAHACEIPGLGVGLGVGIPHTGTRVTRRGDPRQYDIQHAPMTRHGLATPSGGHAVQTHLRSFCSFQPLAGWIVLSMPWQRPRGLVQLQCSLCGLPSEHASSSVLLIVTGAPHLATYPSVTDKVGPSLCCLSAAHACAVQATRFFRRGLYSSGSSLSSSTSNRQDA